MPLIQQNTFYGKIYLKSCAGTYHCITVDCFLHILLLTNILDLNLKTTSTGDRQNNDQFAESEHKFDWALQLYQGLLFESIRIADILGNVEFTKIEQIIQKERLLTCPTTRFWKHMNMIRIMKIVIWQIAYDICYT